MRINPRNSDPEYVENGRAALYGDVSTEEYLRFAAYLNPDLPLPVAFDDARGTPERWGAVPRTFIRCTEDHTVPLALQDRMIAEADGLTPGNRFESDCRVEVITGANHIFSGRESQRELQERVVGWLSTHFPLSSKTS